MNPFFQRFGTKHPVVLPVIHVETADQAVQNAALVETAGGRGVFLINHSIAWRKLIVIVRQLHREFPNLWLGVNCLDLDPEEVFGQVDHTISGIWVDNAEIDERRQDQSRAEHIIEARRQSGWSGLYFGGVAFKYQRAVTDLETAAHLAARYMDVVTTSGPGTGHAASREKIAALRRGLGDAPLAIASGITPENVLNYLGFANCFLVATGISRSFTELDPSRLQSLLQIVAAHDPQTALAARVGSAFLQKQYVLPSMPNRRVLVLGVGGGSDILSAYAIAGLLKPHKPELLVYANTKRWIEPELEQIAPLVFRLPGTPIELNPNRPPVQGTTQIDQSVPRSDDGCPLIVRVPATVQEENALIEGLKRKYGFDVILSVDTGADSIAHNSSSGTSGRDQQMLRLLSRFGCEWLHFTVAPGCDGETTETDLSDAIANLERQGKYLGCFPVDKLLPTFARWADFLDAERTPNIILNAAAGKLESNGDSVIIPREFQPAIPVEFLKKVLVFGLK